MLPEQRVVTVLPLPELWNDRGPVVATRGAALGEPEIAQLMAEAGATFVVADVGHALAWVPGHERFAFWRRDVKGRVVAP